MAGVYRHQGLSILCFITMVVFCGCETKAVGATHEAEASHPKRGHSWVNALGMKFVPVPGTSVLFGIWEVRVRDFEAFISATGYDAGSDWHSPSFEQSPLHPVSSVSWNDAQAFCLWLTEVESREGLLSKGQTYRLPTDEEWSRAVGLDFEHGASPAEKNDAVRDVYPWGTQWPPPPDVGNYSGKGDGWDGEHDTHADGVKYTAKVGSYQPNKLGIFDLGGNVWEWCEERYSEPSPGNDIRVLRGASFNNDFPDLLASHRGNLFTSGRVFNVGFRCVLAVGGDEWLPNAKPEPLARAPDGLAKKPNRFDQLRGNWLGTPRKIPDIGLELIPIAPGRFVMGSPSSEPHRRSGEGPLTIVNITTGYWLGKTEVTQSQWNALMGENPSSFKGDDLPVDSVTWTSAMSFCRRLSDREHAAGRLPEGYAYTLPTEAQWEYACRAGSEGPYAGRLREMWDPGSQSYPVGQLAPNAWGLHDMHGNVQEWCSNWYSDELPGGTVADPVGPPAGSVRACRGGSWFFNADHARSAYRYGYEPDFASFAIGFRVVLSSTR